MLQPPVAEETASPLKPSPVARMVTPATGCPAFRRTPLMVLGKDSGGPVDSAGDGAGVEVESGAAKVWACPAGADNSRAAKTASNANSSPIGRASFGNLLKL
ncbi:hypothetical protein AHIS1636_00930 [Arthrobacter mangrovi]|uniref:Uncharacterized protein n=1 Tax=Arthrobacter mangrovi TaxID=2966350 RepID=A0ABQ5MNV1_9MICC|nr:hypothetical protein AHIS1636_00930 [Arthrobacter mangrovi]